MLTTAKIRQFPTDAPSVYAFRIEGGVTADEMAAMADLMIVAFDRGERISVLVVLDDFDASDASAALAVRSLRWRARAPAGFERCAVIGEPAVAATMIGTFDKVGSIEAKAFYPAEEAEAWAFVGARPTATAGPPKTFPKG